jgi:hypothetical protein
MENVVAQRVAVRCIVWLGGLDEIFISFVEGRALGKRPILVVDGGNS